ncbi:syntaxin-1A-like [Cimex lectularius]|uniref:t-SNARE coiled-coil homology domain-containing protein n=1 Tax=Cimex lectularius TaxID=79782 RepID=A0A8I6TEJ4_CIMLE|nr:syntaxin-1A-like [Cimex lectularius]
MTKDRINALQSILQQRAERGEDDEIGEGVENIALQIEDENAGYMEHFFKEMEQTRGWIDEINDHITIIKTLHSSLLSSPRPDEGIKQEIESRTAQVKQLGKKVSVNLKALEKGIRQEEEEIETNGRMPAGLRIRRTQHSATLHLFMEAMCVFNSEQVDYREKCTERIHRVISIAKAVVPEEKIEELLDQGNYGPIFNGDIITETKEARKALEDVQARHQELLSLEKSIQDLRDLFLEMALLVDQQGDLINHIENHVLQAVDHVELAQQETKKAIKMKRKANKKLIIIIIILALILLAVIITLVSWPKSA